MDVEKGRMTFADEASALSPDSSKRSLGTF